jgi:putative membrane protein
MLPEPLPFRDNRLLQLMVAWLLLFWLAMAVEPYDRFDWFLENLLVVIYGVLLVATYRRFRFSNLSYGLFTLFLTLHLVGAHYTYSETPFGFWLQEVGGFQRNHYDRLVHFAYGLLSAYPFWELLVRAARTRPVWAKFVAPALILAFSAFFELLEAAVAMIVSPEAGDAYLGTQGDVWDAQHDMFLGFLGAIIAMVMTRNPQTKEG